MKFTIAITNYNYGRYLRRAIDSALEQGARVIVIDDCSTDDSMEVLHDYRENENLTVIAHKENSGFLTQGRREGIEFATGDWLIHMDADDFLMPAALSTFRAFADGADWLVGNIALLEGERATRTWDYADWPTDPQDAIEFCRENRTLPVSMKGAFRLEWLRENDLSWYEWPNTTFAEDCRTCLEYLKHDPVIRHVPYLTLCYRIHDEQDSKNDERRAAYQKDLADYFEGESL